MSKEMPGVSGSALGLVAPDPEFVPIVAAAVAQRPAARHVAREAIERGLKNVFLIGCGGSLNDFSAAHFLLERHATAFPAFCMNSDEFVRRRPGVLGRGSLAMIASHHGKTRETLEAARLAREAGAYVVVYTIDGTTPLASLGDTVFTYASNRTILAPKQVLIGDLAYALLEESGAPYDYDGVRAAFDALPDALALAHAEADETLARIAGAIAAEPVTYVLSAGPNQGTGYGFAMCYLMEMQWKNAAWFNANEFFHGAFEVVTEETPVVLFLGEDESRPVAERARAFLDRYTKRAHAVDSRLFSLPGVPAERRGDVTPLALSTISKRLAEHLQAVTGHSLKDRRYMFTVTY
jgi:fructoselysine-6-P-deglycase FrlB-like protein